MASPRKKRGPSTAAEGMAPLPPGAIVRRDGSVVVKFCVNLPVALHRRIVTYCAGNYVEHGKFASEAFERYLGSVESSS